MLGVRGRTIFFRMVSSLYYSVRHTFRMLVGSFQAMEKTLDVILSDIPSGGFLCWMKERRRKKKEERKKKKKEKGGD